MKGRIVAVVFLLMCIGLSINFVIDLSQIFSWQRMALGLWLLQLADFIGGVVAFLLIWFFYRLVSMIFGKTSFERLSEIIWSFVQIIPQFFWKIFPILKKMWTEQVQKNKREGGMDDERFDKQ
jgi:type IV secretory pathway VirB2 component (pilin)